MDASKTPIITWKIHLRSAPEAVYRMLATKEGRSRFWADAAEEEQGVIHFRFSNGQQLEAPRAGEDAPGTLSAELLRRQRRDLRAAGGREGRYGPHAERTRCPTQEYEQNRAGWVSVLLMLKAAVDFSDRSAQPRSSAYLGAGLCGCVG
jgi:hypothetical protein